MRSSVLAVWLAVSVVPAIGAVSLPTGDESKVTGDSDAVIKEARSLFEGGRHAKALEMIRPLADKGNAEALYLLGFAHETGNGVDASRDKALEYYRKAADSKHKDAIYRLSFILLASEDEKERGKAREELEKAAKDDPAVAGRILGEAYLRGLLGKEEGKEADSEKALFWWNQAADAGDVLSLMMLAKFYEGQFGFADKKDEKKALGYYEKAAGLGNAGAMASLGSRYLSGEEKFRDEAKGREWLKKAAAAKEYSAYLALGDYEEHVKKDLKAALQQYERGKDAGNQECILRCADFYFEGKGVEKDEERGNLLLAKAAEAGHPVAHLRMAASLLSKEEPANDVMKGYAHLVAAANGGLGQAQNEIGLLYLSGKLGAADGPAAVSWLTRAAQGGFAQAQFNLGTLYERGLGSVQQNIENAGQLYSLAANQGHGGATLALARLVGAGVGTKKDLPKAWALAKLADERGEKEAADMLKELQGMLDVKGLEQAKKELDDIKSGKPAPEAKSGTPSGKKPE